MSSPPDQRQQQRLVETLQSLWKGYGVLQRVTTPSSQRRIVKRIDLPAHARRRSGSVDVGTRRKIRSYEVERSFYRHFAEMSSAAGATVPKLLSASANSIEMEDLDAAPRRLTLRRRRFDPGVRDVEILSGLRWLARFHAVFLRQSSSPRLREEEGALWKMGTYWHLETRPDELAAMPHGPLKRHANAIDLQLREATWRTLVHGDAKLMNFCWSADGKEVAAVDFQYVGGGVGPQDVVYFLSCLAEPRLERNFAAYVDAYFEELRVFLRSKSSVARSGDCLTSNGGRSNNAVVETSSGGDMRQINDGEDMSLGRSAQDTCGSDEATGGGTEPNAASPTNSAGIHGGRDTGGNDDDEDKASQVEAEWRALIPFAAADFQRFLEGWAPGHEKITPFWRKWADLALEQLDQE